jgi:glycosyltransferase involved in cell wall biosynthesis
MKKIAYFLDSFPHYSETFIKNELVAMREHPLELHIFAVTRPKGPAPFDDIADFIARTFYLPSDYSRVARVTGLLYALFRNPAAVWRSRRVVRSWGDSESLYLWSYCLVLVRLLRQRGIAHIHAHFANKSAELAMLCHLISGIPYSFIGHGRDVFCNRRLLAEKMRYARYVMVTADYTTRFLHQEYPEIDLAKYHKIIMGVDPAEFKPALPVGGDEGKFEVVSVARLEEKKGLCDLIEAMAIVRKAGIDARLRIVGEGGLRASLQEQIGRLALTTSCRLEGALPPEQVRRMLRDADVFSLPCVVARDGDRDSMPVSIKEAMAMEKPVVATAEVAIPEMVREGAGILVPPHDAEALARALIEVHTAGAAERARMGKIGRRIIETEFSIRGQTVKLAGLLDPALATEPLLH